MQTGDYSLGELAVRFGFLLRGDADVRVGRVATLANAGEGSLSFLANSHYRRHLDTTRAAAVILSADDAPSCPVAALIDRNPYAAYARVAALLHPAPAMIPGIHPSAIVDPEAIIAPSASIGPLSVIEAGVTVGERVAIGPGCIVQSGARIGEDSQLIARVVLRPRVQVGARCVLHPGSVIGADGFGFALDERRWLKVPQVGGVCLGDDVEVGANTTIDCGAIEDTVIGNGVKLDNQIQIGHNVSIGEHTIIASCTGVSGSTVIGKRCMIGGIVGFAGHITIADDVVITGFSMISASLRKAGSYSSGFPAQESRDWWRMVARLKRLGRSGSAI
ncbi:MAG: UDP-3-O-(3-hydroxymyristoyl)glucosamine N-acyltransferase [Steroidobacterales bacterium]